MKTQIPISLLAILALLIAPLARADEATIEARAHAHFEAGRGLYHTENYEEAMHEFALGYDLVGKPEFLVNIGLCHFRLGHLQAARDNFKRFLNAVPREHSLRASVEEQLGEVDKAIAAEKARQPKPIVKPVEPQPVPVTPTPALIVAKAPPPKKPWIKRNIWIVPVSIIVAGGIGVGLGLGLTHNNPCNGAGSCVALP